MSILPPNEQLGKGDLWRWAKEVHSHLFPVKTEEPKPAPYSNTQPKPLKEWRKNPAHEGWYFDPYDINRIAENGEVPEDVVKRLSQPDTENNS